ncbi:hypothetical protein B7463_g12726, partial [Scytalidium lignicola]
MLVAKSPPARSTRDTERQGVKRETGRERETDTPESTDGHGAAWHVLALRTFGSRTDALILSKSSSRPSPSPLEPEVTVTTGHAVFLAFLLLSPVSAAAAALCFSFPLSTRPTP